MSSFSWPPCGVPTYVNFAAFPATAAAGALALARDTDTLYAYDDVTVAWVPIASPGSYAGLTVGTYDSLPGVANGLQISGGQLFAQSATETVPGMVSTSDQIWAANKRFTGIVSMGQTLTQTESDLFVDIRRLSIGNTDTNPTQTRSNGAFAFGIVNNIQSTIQVPGQARGAIIGICRINPAVQTTYGGNYRGFQMTATNNNGILTGQLVGGIQSVSTIGANITAIQTGLSVQSGGSAPATVRQSTTVAARSANAIGAADTVAHLAMGVRIGDLSIKASGSTISNTAIGIRIENTITAADTAAAAYAIQSLSTAQSTFAGSITATTITATSGFTPRAANNQSASYGLLATDVQVNFTTAASTLTATLPTAVGNSGKVFSITKVDAGSGFVQIATTSAQTVGGYASNVFRLTAQNTSIEVVSDGTNWQIQSINIELAAYATRGSTQALTGGADNIIDYSTVQQDRWGTIATGAGWTFTAPLAGWYDIEATGILSATTFASIGDDVRMGYTNGGGTPVNVLCGGQFMAQAATTFPTLYIGGTSRIALAAGGVVQIYVNPVPSTTFDFAGTSSAIKIQWRGFN